MKKILALILALLLLGSTLACAESAPVLKLSDPVVEYSEYGDSFKLDLRGLTLCLGAPEIDGEQGLVLNILGNDSLLFSAAARINKERILFTADGLSHSYLIPLETITRVGYGGLDVDAIRELLLSRTEINRQGDTVYFRIPVKAVLEIIEEFLPALQASDPYTYRTMVNWLQEMRATNSGPELSGSLTRVDDGVEVGCTLSFFENGKYARTLIQLDFELEPNLTGASFLGQVKLYDEYEETLAPLFGFSGEYSLTAANKSFELLISGDPDGTGSMQKLIRLNGALTQTETGHDFRLDFSIDTELDGRLQTAAVLSGSVAPAENGVDFTVQLSFDPNLEGAVRHVGQLSGSVRRMPYSVDFELELLVDPALGGNPSYLLGLSGFVRPTEGGGDLRLEGFAPSYDGGEPGQLFRFDGSITRDETEQRLEGLLSVADGGEPGAQLMETFLIEGVQSEGAAGTTRHLATTVYDYGYSYSPLDLTLVTGEDFRLEMQLSSYKLEIGYEKAGGALHAGFYDNSYFIYLGTYNLSATLDLTAAVEEGELSVCDFPGAEIDVNLMSDAQLEALMSELSVSLAGVAGFLLPALNQAGLLG